MNMLKKAILKMAVSFGLIFCLGAAANAEIVTVEVGSNYGNVKESKLSKQLHHFAFFDKVCREYNLGDDILKMCASNLLGSNNDLSEPVKDYLDIPEEKVTKLKKLFKEFRGKRIHFHLTEQEVEKSRQKAIKLMRENLEELTAFVNKFEVAERNGQKGKEQFVIDEMKKHLKEAKNDLNKEGLNEDQKAHRREYIDRLTNILGDEAKLKEQLKKSISSDEKLAKFYKEEYIPAMETKLDMVEGLSTKSMNIETLNKNFVLSYLSQILG